MSEQTIKCPKCGAKIPLTEALTSQIENVIRSEYESEAVQREKEHEKDMQALKRQLGKQNELVEEKVAEQMKAERKKIAQDERKKIIAEQSEQTKALQEEIEEKNSKISKMQKNEINLLKEKRELEQKKQELELENQRKLDQAIKRITEEAIQNAEEKHQLKDREKDNQLVAFKKRIDELQRQAEIGSQEAQGEALEGALQDVLQQTFPFDFFEEVKKGQRGGDILQIVRNPTGKECGKILWESKYTRDFQKGWIEKLKKDQQEAGAEIAVITTVTLPKEIKNFGPMENVWVTDFASATGLSAALRMGLINAAREKALTENKETLKDVIYKYVTGQEFSMQIRAVAEAFIRMQGDLNKEKRAMERIWKSREKQIETVLSNLAGIRGSLEGYVGQKLLPSMETLSLEAIETDETEPEA